MPGGILSFAAQRGNGVSSQMVTCGEVPVNGSVACYTRLGRDDWIWKTLGGLFQVLQAPTSAGRGNREAFVCDSAAQCCICQAGCDGRGVGGRRAPVSTVMHRGWSVTRGLIDWCGRNRGHISNTRSDPQWWGSEMEGAEMELQ